MTQIGGADGQFRTTEWAQILSVRDPDEGRQRAAHSTILGAYWKPVYCYLRRKGHDNEKAKDLTQGFFTDIVLGRNLPARADQAKGRFRTFLLTALECYLADEHRKARAAKRRPERALLSLDGADAERLPEPAEMRTPEQAFHHQWAANLVDEVLAEVEASCRDGGQETHWRVFEARCVGPILHGGEPESLPALCRRYGISNEKQAANMAVTVKRRFARAMRSRIRQWAGSQEQVSREIEDLLEILSHGGAAPGPSSRIEE